MRRPFNGTFPITQEWGVNPQDYSQFGLKGHNGVDYGCPTGTPILAPHNGTVIEAAYDQYGYGNYVKIENDQEGSILAHFQSFNVNVGDVVSEGQQVGVSDNTGNSTGQHLHWGYFRKPRNKSDGYSGTTNPYPYLQEQVPVDECPAKLVQITVERDRLNGIITGKDQTITNLNATITQKDSQIASLQATNSNQESSLLIMQKNLDVATKQADLVPELNQKINDMTAQGLLRDKQITGLQGDLSKLQGKYDMMKKPFKDILATILDKLNQCIKT